MRLRKLLEVVSLCEETALCRRQTLLAALGASSSDDSRETNEQGYNEQESSWRRNCCDVCDAARKDGSGVFTDVSAVAAVAIRAVARMQGAFSLRSLEKLLRGSLDASTRRNGHDQLPEHGAGRLIDGASCASSTQLLHLTARLPSSSTPIPSFLLHPFRSFLSPTLPCTAPTCPRASSAVGSYLHPHPSPPHVSSAISDCSWP